MLFWVLRFMLTWKHWRSSSLFFETKERKRQTKKFLDDCLLFLNHEEMIVTPMDPQAFVRLSIGSLGLRNPVIASKLLHGSVDASSSKFLCEIRLRGFPVQTVSIPLMSRPQANPDPHGSICIFNLEKSDVKVLAPTCFSSSQAYLEITVFAGRQGSHCGISGRKQQIGVFRLEVDPEWGTGRSVLLHNGWIGIGKSKHNEGKPGPELHLRVKLDPDPRYVFQFEDETASSPQIVQLQGSIKQPIFSCKFSRDRRSSASDPLGNYWSSSNGATDNDSGRERKGWKVVIHDLCGSAVAAASMSTPFVPATGSDRVSRSNPGAWLILRPDPAGLSDSWHPWGRLEAWRESGTKDSVFLRLYLLPDGNESGVIVSDVLLSADKGGEFFIDMDRHTSIVTAASNPQSNGTNNIATELGGYIIGGFVMNCKVQGEGKSSKPLVQLAMQHVTCVEDAAIFIALAAAVDLSIEACRPFRRKAKRSSHNSL